MGVSLEELASKISKPATRVEFISMLLYGASGVGKTSMFAGAGPETLILDVEHGTDVLPASCQADVLHLDSWEELEGVMDWVHSGELGSKYRNVVLDSVSEMQKLCEDYVLQHQTRSRTSPDTLSQQDWGVVSAKMKRMVRDFRAGNFNVIYTALTKSEKDEVSGEMLIEPLMIKSLAQYLPGSVSIVGYMGITKDTRIIAFESTSKFIAKDRTHTLGKAYVVQEDPAQNWKWLASRLPVLQATIEEVA